MQRKKSTLSVVVVLLLVAAGYGIKHFLEEGDSAVVATAPPAAPAGGAAPSISTGTIEAAFAARTSSVMVEAAGTVTRTLADDNEGSRHQRFIVELPSGHTVLIAHNIDLAPRVPLREDDRVRVFGEYEWNERGGVIHWTHHDPKQWRDGGWIEHDGQRYE